MARLLPATFQIDCYGPTKIFKGVTAGESWNGFACPRFTRAVAIQIMEAHRAMTTERHAWYDATRDAFCFVQEDIPAAEIDQDHPPVETDVFEGFNWLDERLYAVGAWGWTWSEVDEDEESDNGHRRNEPFCAKCGGECQYDDDGNLKGKSV